MNTELYHYGVRGMKWGVRKERNLQKATNEYRKNKKLVRQYSKVSKPGTWDNPQAVKLRRRVIESDERLKRHVRNYLATVNKEKLSELVEYDSEHGRHFVNARLLDPRIGYEAGIYLD